ncbi:unnamed protein product [Discula destructiva]
MKSQYGSVNDERLAALTTDLSNFVATPLVRQITGGIHVNDALIHDAWDALSPAWTAYWDAFSDHRLAQRELIDSIDEDTHQAEIMPLGGASNSLPPPQSLVEWLLRLKAVSLPRVQRKGPMLALPETLSSFMTTKKINEVSVAAAYIQETCQSNAIKRIIDMGSGQGYLSITLASLFPDLRVLAIDGSESQIAGSEAFAASLGVPESRITHLTRYIDGSASLAAEMETWADGQKCMLVGLHACGNLSEHMLRYFQMCPFITQLGAVGCCYNHIVPRSDECPDGFPISHRLRERNVVLTATALMTGCQAPNNWEKADLTQESSVYSKKHFYRAVLEKLLHDKSLRSDDIKSRPTWGIRKGDLASFEKFSRRATHCLGLDEARVSNEDIREYEERYKDHEGRIAILWTLSILCCKAVESVVALDRYWYLVEHGFEGVDIVPIFDYKISPRNLMIVAKET